MVNIAEFVYVSKCPERVSLASYKGRQLLMRKDTINGNPAYRVIGFFVDSRAKPEGVEFSYEPVPIKQQRPCRAHLRGITETVIEGNRIPNRDFSKSRITFDSNPLDKLSNWRKSRLDEHVHSKPSPVYRYHKEGVFERLN